MKRLIKNQRLRVDSHTRGESIPSDLTGVHIHKSFYEGQRKWKSVRISIKGDSIEFDKDFKDKERQIIVKEIRKVLEKDRQKLIEFASYIAGALYRWSRKSVEVEQAERYASGIAEQFGLNPEASKTLIKNVRGQMVQYVSFHRDSDNRMYMINQNSRNIIIRPEKVVVKGLSDEFLEYDFTMGADVVKCPHCGADVPCSLFLDNEVVECPECGKEIKLK